MSRMNPPSQHYTQHSTIRVQTQYVDEMYLPLYKSGFLRHEELKYNVFSYTQQSANNNTAILNMIKI
jgi:hypothetical protein